MIESIHMYYMEQARTHKNQINKNLWRTKILVQIVAKWMDKFITWKAQCKLNVCTQSQQPWPSPGVSNLLLEGLPMLSKRGVIWKVQIRHCMLTILELEFKKNTKLSLFTLEFIIYLGELKVSTEENFNNYLSKKKKKPV